jgi:uncharacterized protein YegJ (DUF2314 family)
MSVLKEKALVVGGGVVLAAVVIWVLAKKEPPAPPLQPLPDAVAEAAVATPDASQPVTAEVDAAKPKAPPSTDPLPHDHEVTVELAVIAPKANAAKLAELAALTPEKWALTSADCAGDCAPLRKFLSDSKATVEVMAAADWILPPKDTLGSVARNVPEAERASLYDAKEVLVVHVQGEDTQDHMPFRGGFALAEAFARDLRGYVHDEVTHRIDPALAFAERLPKTPIGTPFFVPESLLVELHPLDDDDVAGPYRLLTLGMARYGVPDLEMRGFHEKDGSRLAAILNAVASKLAQSERGPEIHVSLVDVARTAKKKPDELTRNADKSKDLTLRLTLAERTPADPDNDVYRIEAPADGGEEAHVELLRTLYGDARVLTAGTNDPALLAAEARAKKSVGAAAAKWKKAGGSLTLRVPFPVPNEKGKSEVMWMKAKTCDDAGTCKGTLASRPVFVKNLEAGADVSGKLSDVSDYLLELADGTKEGGETIQILERAGR